MAADSYGEALLIYLRRARWLHGLVVLEIMLVAGGFGIAQLGSENTTLGAHPDVHLAMGGLMGALAVAFGAVGIFVVLVTAGLRVNEQFEENVQF
jgi:uncharacterized membrane protein